MAKNVTLLSTVKTFVTSQSKGGAVGLRMLRDCLSHVEAHKDWTPLAWLIAKSEAKDARVFRAITGVVTKEISMSATSKEAKTQPSGLYIKLGKDWGFTNKWGVLNDCVDEGISFRSADVQSRLLDKDKDTVFTLEKAVKSYRALIKKIEEGHMTLDQVLKLVAAQEKINADLASPTVIEKPQPIKAA